MTTGSENKALIEVLKELHQVDVLIVNNEAVAYSAPTGMNVESIKPLLDMMREYPERKRGTTTLTTLEAFCDFANRHSEEETVAFVDDTNPLAPKLIAVFNAHGASLKEPNPEGTLQSVGGPDWQDHRAVYAFPVSDEWTKWTKLKDGFSQGEFAEFLEDRITDVLEPSNAGTYAAELAMQLQVQLAGPARLLELSRGLAVHVDGRVQQSVNLSSGEGQLIFQEQHKDEAGQALRVPGAFAIGIPVFRGGAPYRIPVRLRYRVSAGRVTWHLALQRHDRVFEDAIAEAAQKVEDLTKLPVFRGAPERA